MKKKHYFLPSKYFGRNIHLWQYGHFGMPILVFPTAAGFAHEWELHSMIDTLAEFILRGKIKLYCPESNVAEAITRDDNPPEWRIKRYQDYEKTIIKEIVPFIYKDCRVNYIPIAVAGASLGATYAANFALKFPKIFTWALCMSGRYNLYHFFPGFNSLDIYFNSPLAYVPNIDGKYLEEIKNNTFITLVVGQGPYEEGCIEETVALAKVFRFKGIPHELDLRGKDTAHDWPWWKQQTIYHISKRFS